MQQQVAVIALCLGLVLPASAQTFDLIPVRLNRVEGGLDSAPPTPVRVQVAVMNASAVDMPAAHAAAGWTVQVQGYSANPYIVRRALRAGEQHDFTVTVIVPCGKVTELEVRVNAARAFDESSFDNNRAVFPVQGNACPIAIKTGAALRQIDADEPARVSG